MENFNLAEETIEFADGQSADWDAFQLPIPDGLVVFTTDSQVFKVGNGHDLYSDLPDGPSIAGAVSGGDALTNTLADLLPADEDFIIYINNEMYEASTTKIADLVARLNAILVVDSSQDVAMGVIDTQGTYVDSNISGTDTGKFAVVQSAKMSPGSLPGDVETLVADVSPIHIRSLKIYSTVDMINEVTELQGESTYYAAVNGMHDEQDIDNVSFGLTSIASELTITTVERNTFKIDVGVVALSSTVGLTATAVYGTDSVERNYSVGIHVPAVLVNTYGGAGHDYFNGVTIDSNGNTICVGTTSSEGIGTYAALIVKFDSDLNVLDRKTYSGSGSEEFKSVAVDSNGDIFTCGYSNSLGSNNPSALIIKFDTNLNVLIAKSYGGSINDYGNDIIIDSNSNVFIACQTHNEGSGVPSGIIIKFNSSLVILARKYYGGSSSDTFLAVAIDSQNNVFCAGYTKSEGGSDYDALIIKFDNDLNKIAGKVYGGTLDEAFYGVTVDSSGSVICVGYDTSEGEATPAGNNMLIVKFDNDLNKIAGKVYGGLLGSVFDKVTTDANDNIIAVGTDKDSGDDAVFDMIVVKFDTSLAILSSKIYGGVGDDRFKDVITDANDKLICVGHVASTGSGDNDAIVVKITSNLPGGTLTGTILSLLTMTDVINLVLADSTLTLADSALTLANSNLTLGNVSLTLADSNLISTFDELA